MLHPTRRQMLLGAAAGLGVVPLEARAHGATRQKIVETIIIDAPPAKVWAIVGNFQDMRWLPPVAKTEGSDGNSPDKALRTLTLKDGNQVVESLYKYDAAQMMYAYRIEKVDVKVLPVTNYSSQLYVLPEDGGKTKVEWHGAFYRGFPNNDPPPALNDAAAIKAVSELYRLGLDNLKALAEKKA